MPKGEKVEVISLSTVLSGAVVFLSSEDVLSNGVVSRFFVGKGVRDRLNIEIRALTDCRARPYFFTVAL